MFGAGGGGGGGVNDRLKINKKRGRTSEEDKKRATTFLQECLEPHGNTTLPFIELAKAYRYHLVQAGRPWDFSMAGLLHAVAILNGADGNNGNENNKKARKEAPSLRERALTPSAIPPEDFEFEPDHFYLGSITLKAPLPPELYGGKQGSRSPQVDWGRVRELRQEYTLSTLVSDLKKQFKLLTPHQTVMRFVRDVQGFVGSGKPMGDMTNVFVRETAYGELRQLRRRFEEMNGLGRREMEYLQVAPAAPGNSERLSSLELEEEELALAREETWLAMEGTLADVLVGRDTRLYLLYDPLAMEAHALPSNHPEIYDVPERMLQAVMAFDHLVSSFPASFHRVELAELRAPLRLGQTAREVMRLAHTPEYIKALEEVGRRVPADGHAQCMEARGPGARLMDAWMTSRSVEAVNASIHTLCKAVDLLLTGRMASCFCAVRPPGHHAGSRGVPALRPATGASSCKSLGFCLACNAILAARYAQHTFGVQRVAIVDTDVHHGNGVEELSASLMDPSLLYCSIHAWGERTDGQWTFPGTGKSSPHPFVANFPVWPKVTPSAMRDTALPEISRRLRAYRPELIIISAGFDTHKEDPMGLGALGDRDLYEVAKVLGDEAKLFGGVVLTTLEGGYCHYCATEEERGVMQHLGRGIRAHCLGLVGLDMVPEESTTMPTTAVPKVEEEGPMEEEEDDDDLNQVQ